MFNLSSVCPLLTGISVGNLDNSVRPIILSHWGYVRPLLPVPVEHPSFPIATAIQAVIRVLDRCLGCVLLCGDVVGGGPHPVHLKGKGVREGVEWMVFQ